MSVLKSKRMKSLLKKGLRFAKRFGPPQEGSIRSLFTYQARNGWYYQVDYINDRRFRPDPYVGVYAFRPKGDYSARFADYYLESVYGELK